MKVAIIGTGIAGMAAAWHLHQCGVEIDVFEKDSRIGGHTNTVRINENISVDTGFIVYNELNYPNLTALFKYFDVETQQSNMSFSVSRNNGNFEYAGTSIWTLFAQWQNLFSTGFHRMCRDILRFYRDTPSHIPLLNSQITLNDYLQQHKYSDHFINDHILPMGGAIWSASNAEMKDFPALTFLRFFKNHGLLEIKNRPQWRTVAGGSQNYLKKLTQGFTDKIHINHAVTDIKNTGKSIEVKVNNDFFGSYDHVIFACHANQTASILKSNHSDMMAYQRLSHFSYSDNIAYLHTDTSLMPKRKRAWASWNYMQFEKVADSEKNSQNICITYWLNMLQNLPDKQDYFVTLNPDYPPEENKIIKTIQYQHPIFNRQAIDIQKEIGTFQGHENMWYCGSYCGYGFHEDALSSALKVAEMITGKLRPWSIVEASNAAYNATPRPALITSVAAA